jgi:hypothetical protein
MKSLVAFLLLFLSAHSSIACTVQPAAQHTPADDLISRTANIALVTAVRADAASNGWDVLYTFRTIKWLKGEPQVAFQLLGQPAIWETSNQRFEDHFHEAFWGQYAGRSYPDTSCQIRPQFAVGGTYLVFLDQPYHHKSFEMILMTEGTPATKDKWLQYVEKRTGP